jgi:hypothetical protein
MKIKYLAFTIGLLLINISIVQSQIPVSGSDMLLDKLRLNKGINGVEPTLYANINGDPFIFKDFAKGKLIVVNSDEKFDVLIRYDTYANEMHFKVKNEIYAIIHPEKVKAIETDSLKFIYSKFSKSPGEESAKDGSYFIVKADGKCKLLIKKSVRIQDAEPTKLYVEAKPAKFIPLKDAYYLKLKDENSIKIRNEKELLTLLADQNQALAIFIKSNKLDVKNIEDLTRIIAYYNQL